MKKVGRIEWHSAFREKPTTLYLQIEFHQLPIANPMSFLHNHQQQKDVFSFHSNPMTNVPT